MNVNKTILRQNKAYFAQSKPLHRKTGREMNSPAGFSVLKTHIKTFFGNA